MTCDSSRPSRPHVCATSLGVPLQTTNEPMKTLTIVAFALLIPATGSAQDGRLNFDLLDKLAARASEKQEVSIDALMLASYMPFLPNGSQANAAKEVLSELKGLYVRRYEFDNDKAYSMDEVNALRKQLLTPNWSKIVSNEEKGQGNRELQEIYLFQPGGKISGLVIISAEPGELSVVNIVGPIDFDKLRKLDGIFGIPRIPASGFRGN